MQLVTYIVIRIYQQTCTSSQIFLHCTYFPFLYYTCFLNYQLQYRYYIYIIYLPIILILLELSQRVIYRLVYTYSLFIKQITITIKLFQLSRDILALYISYILYPYFFYLLTISRRTFYYINLISLVINILSLIKPLLIYLSLLQLLIKQ